MQLTAPAAARSQSAAAAVVSMPPAGETAAAAAKKAGGRLKDAKVDVSIAPSLYQNLPSQPLIQAEKEWCAA